MSKKIVKKIVVLLSGGIDSTTCLAMAVGAVGTENVMALNMYYGQKHKKEMESARKVAEFYSVPYEEMDVSSVMKFSNCPLLKASTKAIRHQSYADQLKELGGEGTVDTYVPFRNGLLLSCAASYALCKEAGELYYGAHADDAAGRAYPDCTPEFVAAMNEAISEGTAGKVVLVAPLINWNKARVVREGLRLNAPYEFTWSCYEGGEKPCGECGTCIDRAAAFKANNIKDPALD